MPFRFRLPTLFDGLFAAAHARHASHWGACASCYRTTPWHLDTLRGTYRCTTCGGSPLNPN
ncbi:hypothetical protein [Rubrivirga sp. IMCC45206]|uniref:hypothetical protein n=1 Tax=Rubrivirga sp. IMCC45206 TaxID=3391614 RepID=UPI00398FDDFC